MADNKNEIQDWWIKKAQTAAGFRRNIINNTERARGHTIIGKLYFFFYDPKLKHILPVYDRFPMVFPIEPYNDGFLGLNLHYLSQPEREALLNKLLEYSSSKNLTETTKLRLSYDLLASTKRLASDIRPCIKRYLFSHVQSPFIEITAPEWQKAIQLPVELFVHKR